jgi:hypothetical protein
MFAVFLCVFSRLSGANVTDLSWESFTIIFRRGVYLEG